MTDTKLQIRIGEEEKALWQEKATGMGVTLTEMIKRVVGEFVMTEEKEGVMTEGVVMTNISTEEKEWVGPMFKDDKLNRRVRD